MVTRILSKGLFWIKSRVRRIQRWLGLPTMGVRKTTLILLVLLGLAYVSLAVFDELMTKMGQYAPQTYEPKGFDRGAEVQRGKP